jgi:hypothetical protein
MIVASYGQKKCMLLSVFHPWLYRTIFICSSVDLHDEIEVHACMTNMKGVERRSQQ